MRILNIIGAPRLHGNTVALVKKFTEGAVSAGAEVEDIVLSKLKIRPCIDCDKCEYDGICKTKDDFTWVREKMLAADAFCLASPVYCCNVSGFMKAWMDRCNCLNYPNYHRGLVGKKAAIIVASGYPMPPEVLMALDLEGIEEVDSRIKAVAADSLRCALDLFKPFDATVDALRTLYEFCVFTGMQAVGAVEVCGLAHDPNAVKQRQQDLDKAFLLGVTLVESLKPGWNPFAAPLGQQRKYATDIKFGSAGPVS